MAEQAEHPVPARGGAWSVITGFFLLSFGYVGARFVLGLARTRLLTEVLPKELYGGLTLAVMTLTFCASFLSLGGFEFLVRRLPGMAGVDQAGWLRLLIRRIGLPGWLLAGAAMAVGKAAGLTGGLTVADLALLWVALGLTSWMLYRTFYFLGRGELVRVRLVQLFQHDLWFLAIAGAGLVAAFSMTRLLAIWTVWLAVLAVAVVMLTGRVAWRGPVPGKVSDAVTFGMPLLPMIAGDILFRIADRYILLAYFDLALVAEYMLCMNIAMIVYVVGASLMDLKIPALYAERNVVDATDALHHPSPGMRKVFSMLLRLVLGAGIPAGLALVFFSDPILRLLSGPAFHDAAPLLPWTALVPVLFLVTAVLSRGLLTLDRSKLVGGTTLAAAVASALLSLLFIPRWGAVGAAMAITTSLALLSLVLAWELRLVRWIDTASLKPLSILVMLVACAAVFGVIRMWLGDGAPLLQLAAGGIAAAAMLWISGTYRASDFRASALPSRAPAPSAE